MNNKIILKLNKAKGKITHWDYFHVNRETGYTQNHVFRVKFTSGKDKGKTFIYPCKAFDRFFERDNG